MARYSNAFYNEAYYGAGVSKLPGSVEPVFATAVDYDKVLLTWSVAPGAGTDYIGLRVIRNQDQYPETEEDGIIIDEVDLSDIGPQVSVPQSFEDGLQYTTIPLSSGRYVYYGIWIKKSTDIWVEAGAAQALLPKEHSTFGIGTTELVSTHDKFMNLLPRVYTSATQSPIDTVDTSSTLYRFLSSFTFTIDEILTFIDLLKPDSSGRFINPNVISAAIDQLGITQSGARVTKSQKRLIREALYIYSKKGTKKSLETLVESVTGYSPVVTMSPNIMLSNQDSTFNGGIGNWLPVGDCTIALETFVYPPETASLAIDMNYTAKIVNGTYSPKTQGIPVVPGVEYGFTFYAKTASGTGAAKADIKWYDCYGFEIAASHSPSSVSLSTTWVSGGSSYTAPAKAAYAGLDLTFTATGTYYIDMLQVSDTTKTSVYNEAREVSIFLQPTKSNFLENPSFYPTTDMDDEDWSLNGSAPGDIDGTISLLTHSYGNMVPSFYTVSVYAQCPDGVETLDISISALDSATNEVLVSKAVTAVIGDSWERYQVTVDTTDLTGDFKFEVEISGTTLGGTLNFDAAQLEASYRATDYFDGSVATTGAVWEDDVNDSYSHQYPNKNVKIPQLVHEVYRNLPINTPFRISMYGSDPITGYTR
jgi:hypothetical protein